MTIVLNFIYAILLLFYTPILWFKGKLHAGYRQRLGHIDEGVIRALADKKHIWVHAVSVGEVVAVQDLLGRLEKTYPQYPLVLTTVTKTGYELAQKTFRDRVTILFAPLDFSWIVQKFIRVIDPKIYIATETEWWPNMYQQLAKANIPIIQINGRISDQALAGYQKIPWVTKRIVGAVTQFWMQSEMQKERILQLGAAADKVAVLGNLKFDNLG